MRSFITIGGLLVEDPLLAYRPGSPGEELAVCTLMVATESSPGDPVGQAFAEPTRYRVRVLGRLAEHTFDTVAAHDRVLIAGTVHTEIRFDRSSRRKLTETWLQAMEIGVSLEPMPLSIPRKRG